MEKKTTTKTRPRLRYDRRGQWQQSLHINSGNTLFTLGRNMITLMTNYLVTMNESWPDHNSLMDTKQRWKFVHEMGLQKKYLLSEM